PESRHSHVSETKTRGRTVPAVSSAAAVVVDGHIGPSFFQVNNHFRQPSKKRHVQNRMVDNWSTGERHGHMKPCSPSHSTNAQGLYQAPLLHIGADCSETLFRLNPKRGQRINEGYT